MSISIRTDMAGELRGEYMKEYSKTHSGEPDGIKYSEYEKNGLKISRVSIVNENGEKLLGKPKGEYYSLYTGKLWLSDFNSFKRASNELVRIISTLCDVHAPVLVAGLGNRYITADAIGPLACHNLVVSRHIKQYEKKIYDSVGLGEVSAIVPGVLAQTGIDACQLIRSAVKATGAECVIAVDALACRQAQSLACSVQITDGGISPGSGVGNDRGEISERTVGVKTVCIGVPTVIDARTFVRDALENAGVGKDGIEAAMASSGCKGNTYVCSKDCDVAVDEMARLVGYAISKAYHRSLTYEEMMYM